MRGRARSTRYAFRSWFGGSGGHDVGDLNLLGRTPQTLEVVEEPRTFAEDMHDERAVIEQHPLRRLVAFAVSQAHFVVRELLFDFVADRLHLARAEARAEQERVGKGTELPEVEQRHGSGLFVL